MSARDPSLSRAQIKRVSSDLSLYKYDSLHDADLLRSRELQTNQDVASRFKSDRTDLAARAAIEARTGMLRRPRPCPAGVQHSTDSTWYILSAF